MDKMNDLGKVEDYPTCCAEPKETESKKYYPKTEFTTDQLPGLENLKVGDKVKMTIEAEVCSVSQGEEYGPDDSKKPVKTRVRVKMMMGMAEPMKNEAMVTTKEDQKMKEKNFSKDMGLDTEEETS